MRPPSNLAIKCVYCKGLAPHLVVHTEFWFPSTPSLQINKSHVPFSSAASISNSRLRCHKNNSNEEKGVCQPWSFPVYLLFASLPGGECFITLVLFLFIHWPFTSCVQLVLPPRLHISARTVIVCELELLLLWMLSKCIPNQDSEHNRNKTWYLRTWLLAVSICQFYWLWLKEN